MPEDDVHVRRALVVAIGVSRVLGQVIVVEASKHEQAAFHLRSAARLQSAHVCDCMHAMERAGPAAGQTCSFEPFLTTKCKSSVKLAINGVAENALALSLSRARLTPNTAPATATQQRVLCANEMMQGVCRSIASCKQPAVYASCVGWVCTSEVPLLNGCGAYQPHGSSTISKRRTSCKYGNQNHRHAKDGAYKAPAGSLGWASFLALAGAAALTLIAV